VEEGEEEEEEERDKKGTDRRTDRQTGRQTNQRLEGGRRAWPAGGRGLDRGSDHGPAENFTPLPPLFQSSNAVVTCSPSPCLSLSLSLSFPSSTRPIPWKNRMNELPKDLTSAACGA